MIDALVVRFTMPQPQAKDARDKGERTPEPAAAATGDAVPEAEVQELVAPASPPSLQLEEARWPGGSGSEGQQEAQEGQGVSPTRRRTGTPGSAIGSIITARGSASIMPPNRSSTIAERWLEQQRTNLSCLLQAAAAVMRTLSRRR
jgi:hypothetical protein